MEVPSSGARRYRNISVCWCRSLDREFPGQLLQPAEYRQCVGKDRRRFCFFLLGQRDGRQVHRFRLATKASLRNRTRRCCGGILHAGDHIRAQHWAFRHVEHHSGRTFQLSDVSQHFHSGDCRPRPADRQRLGHIGNVHRWRRNTARTDGSTGRSDRGASRSPAARDLLSLYCVLRVERIKAAGSGIVQSDRLEKNRESTRPLLVEMHYYQRLTMSSAGWYACQRDQHQEHRAGPGSAVGLQFLAVYPVLTGGGVQNSFSLDAASLTDLFGDLGQSFIRAAGCLGGNDGAGGQREKQGVFLPVKIKHHLTRCHGNNLPDWCTEQDDRLIPISPRRYSLDASPTQKDWGPRPPFSSYRIPSRANFLRCAPEIARILLLLSGIAVLTIGYSWPGTCITHWQNECRFCGAVMKRQICVLSLFVLFAFSAVIAQQDGPKQDGPKDDNPLPEAQVLGPQLIAWSEMQEPKPLQQSPSQAPTPEPRPETAPPQQPTPSTQPEQKPTQPPSASQSPDQDQHAQPAAQPLTGTISKEGDTYVLKVSDTSSYKLDDQDQ